MNEEISGWAHASQRRASTRIDSVASRRRRPCLRSADAFYYDRRDKQRGGFVTGSVYVLQRLFAANIYNGQFDNI